MYPPFWPHFGLPNLDHKDYTAVEFWSKELVLLEFMRLHWVSQVKVIFSNDKDNQLILFRIFFQDSYFVKVLRISKLYNKYAMVWSVKLILGVVVQLQHHQTWNTLQKQKYEYVKFQNGTLHLNHNVENDWF